MLPGLRESVAEVIEIIRNESCENGVPFDKIILGGISQGCATAVQVLLLCSGIKLGGFIGLCGFLPFQSTFEKVAWEDRMDGDEISRNVRSVLQILDGDEAYHLRNPNRCLEGKGKTLVFFAHSKNDEVSLAILFPNPIFAHANPLCRLCLLGRVLGCSRVCGISDSMLLGGSMKMVVI